MMRFPKHSQCSVGQFKPLTHLLPLKPAGPYLAGEMGHSVSHLFEDPCPPSRQVVTTYGPIIGRRLVHSGEKQVDAFQGIPFAAPPVGDLRFKHPQAPEPWSTVRECTSFANRGMQNDRLFWEKWHSGPVSEDNLYLNVFTPVWSPDNDKGFPVMVFVHGGAFVSDSAVKYGDIGVSKHLVTKGVVVVTIQYRLGYLGFWSSGDDSVPDNLALYDQTFALRWVQENIASFNGDPSNVTVMGQSAGGASVDLLSISPESRDLFHKVIPMAGNASCDWALSKNAVEICRELAAKHGVNTARSAETVVQQLRQLDAHKFATAMSLDPKMKEMSTEIGPRLDGVFIPKPIPDLRREAPAKPKLVGCCEQEGLIMMIMDSSSSISKMEEIIAHQIREADHPNDFKQLREKMLAKYVDVTQENDKLTLQRAHCELFSDMFLNVGCQLLVRESLDHPNPQPVYFYSFDHCNPKMWGTLVGLKLPFKAATHCTELSYIFNVGIINDFRFTAEDLKMLDYTCTLWSNFAKYGTPNGSPDDVESQRPLEGHERWKPATAENPQQHLSISLSSKMNDSYKDGRAELWLEIKNKKSEIHVPHA